MKFLQESLESKLGQWTIRHRWGILLGSFILVLLAGNGIRFLTFNSDLRVFFSEENPQLQTLETLEHTYTKSDHVVFVLAPKDGNIFTTENLAAVEYLTKASWQLPYSIRVDSITNYQYVRVDGDDLFVENLINRPKRLSATELEQKRALTLSEPMLVNRLISPSGQVTGVSVTILLPNESSDEVTKVAESARKLADQVRGQFPHMRVHLTGMVMFDNAYGEVSQDVLTTLVPAMVLILLVLTALALRSMGGTFVILMVIVMSMGTGLGIAGWMGYSLNPASATAPTIILSVAAAGSIHILTSMLHQIRLGRSKDEAILESFRLNFQAIFITNATTIIGFLTMNFSDAPPFRDLGNIVALGILFAFGYSVLLLPAMLALLPFRVQLPTHSNLPPCDTLAHFVVTWRGPIFWGTIFMAIVLCMGISRIELQDDWIKHFDERFDIRTATDFASNHLTGMEVMEYSLESGISQGIHDPVYLDKVEQFANWYRRQPKVAHVTTITDTLKQLNKAMHQNDRRYDRIPERPELAAQYLLFYEMSLPFGLDLNHRINLDKSASRMTVLLRNPTTREVLDLQERAQNWLHVNAAGTLSTAASGISTIWAHISKRNIESMLGASFGALLLISCLLIFSLRSIKVGLVSLVPNLVPAFMTFGVWGYAIGQIGLASSVVVSLTLGIIVDDTVHFLTKYLRGRRDHHMNPSDAVRYAFHTVGTALVVTSLSLVAGFLVLTLSGFRLTWDLGLLSALTLLLALSLDFLLLPTLLMKIDGWATGRSRVAYMRSAESP